MRRKRLAHVTDCHIGQRPMLSGSPSSGRMHYDEAPEEHRDRLLTILDDIGRRGIRNLVFGGDIGQRNCTPLLFRHLAARGFTSSVILGNHDRYRDVAPFLDGETGAVSGKLCYARDEGPVKLIHLDSSANCIGDDQLGWLARELRGTGRAVLFIHHPVLPIDTPLDGLGAALLDRDRVMDLLVGSGRAISIFCGHYHMADEAAQANIRQFTSPATSYQIVKASRTLAVDADSFGYRIIEFDGENIRTEVVSLTSVPCHAALCG